MQTSKLSQEELEKAKELIDDYCLNEFGHNADFTDMENIGVAFTTLTDEEIPIQICIDLIHMHKKTWIGTEQTDNISPVETEEITLKELEWLDFNDLIYGWTAYIEDNILNTIAE